MAVGHFHIDAVRPVLGDALMLLAAGAWAEVGDMMHYVPSAIIGGCAAIMSIVRLYRFLTKGRRK